LDKTHEPRIRQSLVACFDIGILLSTLDFQLRFAYLAWNQDTFQVATATWRQLSLKVQEAVAEPATQDSLRDIVGRWENDIRNAFFSEYHSNELWEVQKECRQSSSYSSATVEQLCQHACQNLCPFRFHVSRMQEEFERHLVGVQSSLLRLGLLVDEGVHSSDIPLNVFDIPPSAVPTCQSDPLSSPDLKGWGVMPSGADDLHEHEQYYLPRRTPEKAPPRDRDRWIEAVKLRCKLIQRDFPWSRPEAFDVTFDHQASVEQIADAIRRAIKGAYCEEDSTGSSGEASGQVAEPPTETYVFRKGTKSWSIKYGTEESFSVKHLKGLTYIRELLINPKTPHTPESLAMAEGHPDDDTRRRTNASNDSPSETGGTSGDNDYDAKALQTYHDRIREINGELDKAKKWNDQAETERLEREKEAILAHIKKSRGLGGGVASGTTDQQKRHRAVKKCINSALDEIKGHSTCCEKHLRDSINLDDFRYDPAQEIYWSV
jgi:hypothetical protein